MHASELQPKERKKKYDLGPRHCSHCAWKLKLERELKGILTAFKSLGCLTDFSPWLLRHSLQKELDQENQPWASPQSNRDIYIDLGTISHQSNLDCSSLV
jgi:hypothetical protein